MKHLLTSALALMLIEPSVADAGDSTRSPDAQPPTAGNASELILQRVGTQASMKGPDDWFTGRVRIDPLFSEQGDGRASGAAVTFEPGARTVWHEHPIGQTFIVTRGVGRVQREGGPVEEIRPGDVVWIPADVKHWHGAAPDVAMTHIAVQESRDGSPVTWLEPVSDAEYAR